MNATHTTGMRRQVLFTWEALIAAAAAGLVVGIFAASLWAAAGRSAELRPRACA